MHRSSAPSAPGRDDRRTEPVSTDRWTRRCRAPVGRAGALGPRRHHRLGPYPGSAPAMPFRPTHRAARMRQQLAQHGQPVLAEHRLRVELHAGEARAAQRVHRAVGRVAGQLDRAVRGCPASSASATRGEGGVEADPPRRAEQVDLALQPLVGRVPAVQPQPEQPGEQLVAEADREQRRARVEQAGRAARRRAAIFGSSTAGRVARPGADHHQVGAAGAGRASPRQPRDTAQAERPELVGEHAGEGVLAVDDQRAAGRPAPAPPARPGGAASSQNRARSVVAGGQRGPYRRVVGEPARRPPRGPGRPGRSPSAARTPAALAWVSATSPSGGRVADQRRADRHPQRAVGGDLRGADQDRRVQRLPALVVVAEQRQHPGVVAAAAAARAGRSPGRRSRSGCR